MAIKDEFGKLSEQLGDMVEEMMSRNFFRAAAPHAWDPSVNVYEVIGSFLVCVDLGGMRREQIEVQVDGRVLHIRGSRPKPEPRETAQMVCIHAMEIDWGPFQRKLLMPAAVDVGCVSATYLDGYLWIHLPQQKPPAAGDGGAADAGAGETERKIEG